LKAKILTLDELRQTLVKVRKIASGEVSEISDAVRDLVQQAFAAGQIGRTDAGPMIFEGGKGMIYLNLTLAKRFGISSLYGKSRGGPPAYHSVAK
jgi:hypothetical protein